jgi:hypothetical protein
MLSNFIWRKLLKSCREESSSTAGEFTLLKLAQFMITPECIEVINLDGCKSPFLSFGKDVKTEKQDVLFHSLNYFRGTYCLKAFYFLEEVF